MQLDRYSTRRAFLAYSAALVGGGSLVAYVRLDTCRAGEFIAGHDAARVGGPCEGCGAIYQGMPSHLAWSTTIADASEPGERLVISGRILHKDGHTPAQGVILYCYHTDSKGFYSPAEGQVGDARRHGRLRGWMKTGADGRYRFETIKPAPYPTRAIPAHIHPIVKEPGMNEYYIDEFRFEDDPLLTAVERTKAENRGGSGIIRLERSSDGRLSGARDIILGANIPNYPVQAREGGS